MSLNCGTRNMTLGSTRVVIINPNRRFLNGKSIRAKAYADSDVIASVTNVPKIDTMALLRNQVRNSARANRAV
jgi:hypothetical protein